MPLATVITALLAAIVGAALGWWPLAAWTERSINGERMPQRTVRPLSTAPAGRGGVGLDLTGHGCTRPDAAAGCIADTMAVQSGSPAAQLRALVVQEHIRPEHRGSIP